MPSPKEVVRAWVEAFNAGELERDFVAGLPGQGPAATGMPELHKLTPYLGVLQNRDPEIDSIFRSQAE